MSESVTDDGYDMENPPGFHNYVGCEETGEEGASNSFHVIQRCLEEEQPTFPSKESLDCCSPFRLGESLPTDQWRAVQLNGGIGNSSQKMDICASRSEDVRAIVVNKMCKNDVTHLGKAIVNAKKLRGATGEAKKKAREDWANERIVMIGLGQGARSATNGNKDIS